jgi:predicted DNA-binding transcriptional regulator AlpA
MLDIITAVEVAALLGLKNPHTLAVWRHLGKGPRYLKIGVNVRYLRSEVERWVIAQNRDPRKKKTSAA